MGAGTWHQQEEVGEADGVSWHCPCPSPSQHQWKGKAISSLTQALIIAMQREPRGEGGGGDGLTTPLILLPSCSYFYGFTGLYSVSLGRQPCLGRTLWAWQHQNMA